MNRSSMPLRACAVFLAAAGGHFAFGQDQPAGAPPEPPAAEQAPAAHEAPAADQTPAEAAEEAVPSPLSLNLTYYLYSDYVFRGINFSEYRSEGREKPNHQLTTNFGLDVAQLFGGQRGTFGTFGFGTFFEWYAAQEVLNPDGGAQNIQEIDFTLSWAYDLAPLATRMTLGYAFYTFPHIKRIDSQEWTIKLEHNDAWMWTWLWPDNEAGVLNPSVLFVQDVDYVGGCWAEFGISHPFEVAPGLSLTPSALLAIDHRYLGPLTGRSVPGTTGLAYVQYGLTASYDLSRLGRIPMDPGHWTLAGFLYLNDALGNAADSGAVGTELFGGMSLAWTF